MQLLSQQQAAIERLHHFKVGALFMQPGTGKTRTAYELVRSAKPDYILWLTPFQTKQNLREELDKCGGLECDIVGIETLSSSDSAYLKVLDKITTGSFVICDESIKIKNWSAKRSQRIIEIGRRCGYRLVLMVLLLPGIYWTYGHNSTS